MQTQEQESVVIQKTRELCETLLEQPEVRQMRQQMDAFLADDKVRGLYDALMAKGQTLQQKQHSGATLAESEIADFEQMRETFLKSDIGRGFLDAQEGMQKLQQSVNEYVGKTIELGRLPNEDELNSSGSCGSGCGCHH